MNAGTITKQEIKQWIAENPDATQAQQAEALGVSKSTIYRTLHGIRSSRTRAVTKSETKSKAAPKGDQPLEVILTVPENGLAIKFQNGSGRMGTFIIRKDEVTFLRANAKPSTARTFVSRERLARLFESGVL